MANYKLSLAPIRGLTDAPFRTLFAEHFEGFDFSIAPFINPQKQAQLSDKILKDVLPEENQCLPIIPQLLHNNADDFIALANRLAELGYEEINWNLGCPAPMVTRKKRGSGMLAQPEVIVSLLEKIIPQINNKLSIKTRLGYTTTAETKTLLPMLNDFPLTEITIHARLGKQMYRGVTDPDTFEECIALTNHKLSYNGDIVSVSAFQDLQKRFPNVEHWMIGRGAIANPFLPADIKAGQLTVNVERFERLEHFHKDLYEMYKGQLSGHSHILGRMKQIWVYLAHSFPEPTKCFKKIKKAATEEKFIKAVDTIFSSVK